jgi:predicted cupin superfamily sugar epimerase
MLAIVKTLIAELGLRKHPEGGFFRETYRSDESMTLACLPDRYNEEHALATTIYFLITSAEPSRLHRLRSDEVWYFHMGHGMEMHLFGRGGEYRSTRLGTNLVAGEMLHVVVPRYTWFGARVTEPDGYALCSCSVAPGFQFEDFVLGERSQLLDKYPANSDIIQALT